MGEEQTLTDDTWIFFEALLNSLCFFGDFAGHPAIVQVATGAIGDIACTGEDDAANGIVRISEVPRIGEPHEHVGHQRVSTMWSIHREDEYWSFTFDKKARCIVFSHGFPFGASVARAICVRLFQVKCVEAHREAQCVVAHSMQEASVSRGL